TRRTRAGPAGWAASPRCAATTNSRSGARSGATSRSLGYPRAWSAPTNERGAPPCPEDLPRRLWPGRASWTCIQLDRTSPLAGSPELKVTAMVGDNGRRSDLADGRSDLTERPPLRDRTVCAHGACQGTDAIVHLATLPPDGLTGTFQDRHGRDPW